MMEVPGALIQDLREVLGEFADPEGGAYDKWSRLLRAARAVAGAQVDV